MSKSCRQLIGNPYDVKETARWILKHLTIDIIWPIIILSVLSLFLPFMSIISIPPWLMVLFIAISSMFIILHMVQYIRGIKNRDKSCGILYDPYAGVYLPDDDKDDNNVDDKLLWLKCNVNTLKDEIVRIGFVGDIMPMNKYQLRFNKHVLKFFDNVDWIVGNLEGVILKRKPSCWEKIVCKGHSPEILNQLKPLNSDANWLLCLSNNHCGDFGEKSFEGMVSLINAKNMINSFGENGKPTFAILNQINIVAGTMWNNHRKCRFTTRFEHIDQANKFKFNVLSPHWHYENEAYVRKILKDKSKGLLKDGNYEIKGIWRKFKIKLFGMKKLNSPIAWDLVIGHHPHLPQPIIKYPDTDKKEMQDEPYKILAYSGGNFTSGERREKHQSGLICKVEIGKWDKNPDRLVVGELEWSYTYNKGVKNANGKYKEIQIDTKRNKKKSFVLKSLFNKVPTQILYIITISLIILIIIWIIRIIF